MTNASTALGLAVTGYGSSKACGKEGGDNRQYLELQKYTLEKEEQKQAFDAYLKEVAIPALNRLGIKPVGVFYDQKEFSPIYVLLPHPNLESAVTLTQRLLADAEYAGKGAAFVDAPKTAMPYKEVESWLLHAFKGMPTVETPVKSPGRVFQLRIYESPSMKTGQKKIEMFNDAGELKVFREVGMNPVFFGETIFGGKIPNLTYMLGFETPEAQKAAWGKFRDHPEWLKMKVMPEYADARIIRNINNILLKPADYSQI